METASSSSSKKLKHIQVLPCNVMEIDGNEDPDEVFIIGEKVNTSKISMVTKMVYDMNGANQVKDLMVPTSAANPQLGNDVPLENFEAESGNLDFLEDDSWDYDYDDEVYYHDDFLYDETLNLQAQFDDVDLPPGVEAPVPWFDQPSKSPKKQASTSNSTVPSQLKSSMEKEKDDVEILLLQPPKSRLKLVSTSSSTAPFLSSSSQGSVREEEDQVLKKYSAFKRFDTVQDFSDHHFFLVNSKQAARNWTKTIQQEWKILKKDLPDTIFVRVCEERMDILRAVIIGAEGTPYHDGLFFFDVLFPSDYPNVPPKVHYHSGGLRLNPNLYSCGKVCLSLLNTWPGQASSERWTPGTSTMLQVLLSIQALVLNAKPFFNEPGFERMAGDQMGEKKAKDYNENAFVLSCKTMLYSLQRPPKNFEDFVVGHFRERAHAILVACKAYIEGAQVGCLVGGIQDVDEGEKSSSKNFKRAVGGVVGGLVPSFIKAGAKDCERFIPLGDINRTAPLKIRV